MPALAPRQDHVAASAAAVTALFVHECTRDTPLVAIPRPEIQLVVRFGSSARRGLDAHVFGVRQEVRRKVIRAGQWSLTARLRLGASAAVFGVPASALAGRLVGLEELWGAPATERLHDQLAAARTRADAAALVDRAIAERVAITQPDHARTALVLAAAARLATTSVTTVAAELGLSERHLRRVFREAVGLGPKAFARLTRFHRALAAARADRSASWARIAAATGYYDQAHLIDEFRAIAGVTPRALVGELAPAL